MIHVEVINLIYLLSAVLFIIGLKRLSRPESARQGNLLSAIGMLMAVLAALVTETEIQWLWLLVGLLSGAIVGAFASRLVAMTAMPEMVALFNGFGGMASLLVGWAEYQRLTSESIAVDRFTGLIIAVTILVGGVTFTGSLVAWGKLAGKISSKPIQYHGQKTINFIILILLLGGMALFSLLRDISPLPSDSLLWGIILLALILGMLFVLPIGGGDMPVVISLLNSFSGMAACAAGFVIANTVLIVAGALVGSSGIILTNIMCRAMNRQLTNVLFSGFGSQKGLRGKAGIMGEAKPASIEEVYLMLEAAENVLIVPGYGMAVAQAQHAVWELAVLLKDNGTEVNFAIHPVAGRMPGHMNVLLAEANVPYDQLREMDDVNPIMDTVDIALVIGANDVVNPLARTDEQSPIYGMPVINVDKARTVVVLKRSLNTGFAGIDNPLFFGDNTRMLFGDAKKSLRGLVSEFKGNTD